jgi:hypothetical protein
LVSSDRNHTVAVFVNGLDSYSPLGTLPMSMLRKREPRVSR